MYLLDTNVLSEPMRPAPNSRVLTWLDAQDASTLYISAITKAEILLGVAALPNGKRKNALQTQASAMFAEDFAGRCIAFDESAAEHYAQLIAARNRAGAPMSTEDGQIAAIALQRDLMLVTRNVRDFGGIKELRVVDPWKFFDSD
jgi:toxin FitB